MKVINNSKKIITFKLAGTTYSIAPGNSLNLSDKLQDKMEKVITKFSEVHLVFQTKSGKKDNLSKFQKREIQSLINDLKTTYINRLQRKAIHWVTECAKHTTVGGDALETITLPNITTDMMVSIQITEEGASPVIVKTAKCILGGIEVTFSADPSNDHEIDYIVTKHSI